MSHTFTTGNFESFRALQTFHLGAYAMNVRSDIDFLYDGTTMKYGGKDYDVPQLRGMVGLWIVPVADNTTEYKARPAGVVVHAADASRRDSGEAMKIETAFREESVVGSLDNTIAKREGRAPTLTVDAVDGQVEVSAIRRMRVEASDEVVVRTALGSPVPEAPPVPVPVARVASAPAPRPAPAPAAPVAPVPVPAAVGATAIPKGYAKLSAADRETVMRADALNAAAMQAAKAAPVTKATHMGGNLVSSLAEGEVSDGRFRTVVLDGQQGQVVRSVFDTGGAMVASEGAAVAEVQGVNIFSTTGKQIDQKAKPIGTAQVVGSGANRATTVDQFGPAAPQMKVAHVTQVAAEGNVSMGAHHESGATGDVNVTEAGDSLAELLPDAVVAGQVLSARDVASRWVSDNSKTHWNSRSKAAAVRFKGQPTVIDAICALEKPGVVKRIRKLLEA